MEMISGTISSDGCSSEGSVTSEDGSELGSIISCEGSTTSSEGSVTASSFVLLSHAIIFTI